MVHVPMNHRMQPFYRTLAGLIGAYVVAFGVTGVIRTRGLGLFAQEGLPSALGLHANRAFAILSIVVGLVLLLGAVFGGNLDQRINLVSGVIFLGAGLFMLLLLRTDANFLGFTVATCIVSFLIGTALLIAGLYGKVGSRGDVAAEERFRYGRGPDPSPHRLHSPNPAHDWSLDLQREKQREANPPGRPVRDESGRVGATGFYES